MSPRKIPQKPYKWHSKGELSSTKTTQHHATQEFLHNELYQGMAQSPTSVSRWPTNIPDKSLHVGGCGTTPDHCYAGFPAGRTLQDNSLYMCVKSRPAAQGELACVWWKLSREQVNSHKMVSYSIHSAATPPLGKKAYILPKKIQLNTYLI